MRRVVRSFIVCMRCELFEVFVYCVRFELSLLVCGDLGLIRVSQSK